MLTHATTEVHPFFSEEAILRGSNTSPEKVMWRDMD